MLLWMFITRRFQPLNGLQNRTVQHLHPPAPAQVERRELGVLQMLPPGVSRTGGATLVTIELLFALLFCMPL